MAAAGHGSVSCYTGSKRTPPCSAGKGGKRCDACKEAWALYMRNRRNKNVAERAGIPMAKPAKVAARETSSNVVAMPTTTYQQSAAATPDDFEFEIMAHLDELGVVNRALRARVRKLCQILADPDLRGHWVATARHLDEILVRVEGPTKRKKANAGRLQIIQAMAYKNDVSRLDAMNQMNRKTAQ
jgi:hypothetical protein